NPVFVDATGGDFRLAASSPVIDQGVVIPGVNTDYTGTAPDPGAYETTSTFSYLFFDDFEDGISTGWTYKKGTWLEAGGELRGTTSRKSDDIATSFTAGCTTCTVEAYMRVEPGARASLLAWYVDKRNLVELLMAEDRNKWILKQKVSGKVVAKKSVVGSIGPNVDYKARITYDGSQFHVSVNDLPIMDLTPGAIPSGAVGFRVKSLTHLDQTAAFLQIAVW
ncbi:MAG TPA: hypothetical protein VLR94_12215, partial [Acidobacteriota bacterium]|nr:hypothetical protein [Acidobacteriota bacterium]